MKQQHQNRNQNAQNAEGANQAQNTQNGGTAAVNATTAQPNPYYQMPNPYYQNGMSQMQQNYPGAAQQNSTSAPGGSTFNATQLLTGALIGAAATYLLTNENVQKSLFKGVAAMSDLLSGGLDELKERFEDAKAEYEANKAE